MTKLTTIGDLCKWTVGNDGVNYFFLAINSAIY